MEETVEKTVEKTVGETVRETSEKTSEEIILEVLRANPQATVVIMMNATGLTRRGVEYQLKKLKTVQKIRRIGPDKGGYWEVLDKNI